MRTYVASRRSRAAHSSSVAGCALTTKEKTVFSAGFGSDCFGRPRFDLLINTLRSWIAPWMVHVAKGWGLRTSSSAVSASAFPHRAQWPLKRRAKPRKTGKPPLWKERAERWAAGLAAGIWPNRAALARAECVTRAYVTQVLGRLNSASTDRLLNRIDAGPKVAICGHRHPMSGRIRSLELDSTRR